MKVLFDTNCWQQVVRPQQFPKAPHHAALLALNAALKAGTIKGFISETVATLEAIRRGGRYSYLEARAEDAIKIEERVNDDGSVGFRVTIGGRSTAHPGLPGVLRDALEEAISLGFLLLPQSRLATARPPEIDRDDWRIPLTPEQRADIYGTLLDPMGAACREIENRGAGKAQLDAIAERIKGRASGPARPYYEYLSLAEDDEQREIDRAFAEWADGDAVAASIGYQMDLVCTEDQGRSNPKSVFGPGNRSWLIKKYGLRIVGLEELAELVANSR
ncbi:MAG: hypothetical protein H6878_08720 [Rhodobiaceae bacterium]|nr:hypothetical protein [Rhodobiaceae bacterium]